MITGTQVKMLLAVVRLGDADRLRWWRSNSVNELAEYVLAHAFPLTWRATGVELAMESARIRHQISLDRPTAVHLFSDFLPFHGELRAWLITRKLDRDLEPLGWLSEASVSDLQAILGTSAGGERRGNGIYLGDFSRGSLDDQSAVGELFARLTSCYANHDEFIPPYVDLV